jgi:predicted DNA binding protein
MLTVNKANDNLSAAMLSFKSSVKDTFGDKDVAEETGLTPKQLSILRTAYGIDTTKLSKEQ